MKILLLIALVLLRSYITHKVKTRPLALTRLWVFNYCAIMITLGLVVILWCTGGVVETVASTIVLVVWAGTTGEAIEVGRAITKGRRPYNRLF